MKLDAGFWQRTGRPFRAAWGGHPDTGWKAATALAFLITAVAKGDDSIPKAGLVLASPRTLHTAQVETPASFGKDAGGLPARFSLRDRMPPAGNQGFTNSCVGWSVGYGLLSYLQRDATTVPRNPLYVYHWARLNQMSGRNAQVEDKGCKFEDGFQAIINNGACAIGEYADFRLEPSRTLSKDAQQFRANIAHPAYELVASNLGSLKKTLAEGDGKPLPAGFHLDREFQSQIGFETRTIRGDAGRGKPGRDVKVWSKAGTATDVLHAMLITGYDDEIQAFEVMNSYGKDWGDQGYLWVDYDFFKSKRANGKPACCELVYNYTHVRKGLLGLTDKFRNAFHFLFGAAPEELEPDGFCRIATTAARSGRIRPDDLNFEMEPNAEALERLVQKGSELTVRAGIKKLVLRGGLLIDPANQNTTLGPKIDELKGGDRFRVIDLKKVTLRNGRIEYWAKGYRIE